MLLLDPRDSSSRSEQTDATIDPNTAALHNMNLETLVASSGALGAAGASRVGRQIAEWLTDVHAIRGRFHGSLSAARIHITPTGDAVLAPMNRARPEQIERLMSPERRMGQTHASAADDLYALGMIVAEAALGRELDLPDGVLDPQDVAGHIPERLVDALAVLLAPPEARITNAAAAVRIFQRLESAYGDGAWTLRNALNQTNLPSAFGGLGSSLEGAEDADGPTTLPDPDAPPAEEPLNLGAPLIVPNQNGKKPTPPAPRIVTFEPVTVEKLAKELPDLPSHNDPSLPPYALTPSKPTTALKHNAPKTKTPPTLPTVDPQLANVAAARASEPNAPPYADDDEDTAALPNIARSQEPTRSERTPSRGSRNSNSQPSSPSARTPPQGARARSASSQPSQPPQPSPTTAPSARVRSQPSQPSQPSIEADDEVAVGTWRRPTPWSPVLPLTVAVQAGDPTESFYGAGIEEPIEPPRNTLGLIAAGVLGLMVVIAGGAYALGGPELDKKVGVDSLASLGGDDGKLTDEESKALAAALGSAFGGNDAKGDDAAVAAFAAALEAAAKDAAKDAAKGDLPGDLKGDANEWPSDASDIVPANDDRETKAEAAARAKAERAAAKAAADAERAERAAVAAQERAAKAEATTRAKAERAAAKAERAAQEREAAAAAKAERAEKAKADAQARAEVARAEKAARAAKDAAAAKAAAADAEDAGGPAPKLTVDGPSSLRNKAAEALKACKVRGSVLGAIEVKGGAVVGVNSDPQNGCVERTLKKIYAGARFKEDQPYEVEGQ